MDSFQSRRGQTPLEQLRANKIEVLLRWLNTSTAPEDLETAIEIAGLFIYGEIGEPTPEELASSRRLA